VVQGIGFIGAGVLLKGDMKITGLTTAAAIWLAAAVGVACGAGLLVLAAGVTLFSVAALMLLAPVSNALERYGDRRTERLGGKVVREQ
jgi:putative Mg2+ transporter-C (MgtC) family protein